MPHHEVVCTNVFVIIYYVPACSVTGAVCTLSCCSQKALKTPPIFQSSQNTLISDQRPSHEDKRHHLRTWTLATAPRVGPATAEDPALAQTAPAKAARRAAAHAAHPAAPNAPLAVCAKGRLVTQAAVSEGPLPASAFWGGALMNTLTKFTVVNVFRK